jgi:flavin-dependent dehydrogenase
VRVLLVDRATFPRDKLCGDTLNPGALRILGRLGLRESLDADGLALRGMLVTGLRGARGVQVRGLYRGSFVARSLTRRDLDMRLVQAAIDAGAQFQEQVRVLEPIVDEEAGRPIVRGAVLATRERARLRVPAMLTIAADGRRSPLALSLGLARQPARWRRWAIGGYFADVAGLSDVGEMHIREGRYIGVAPMPGGLANVCLVSPARAGFAEPSRLLVDARAGDPQLRDRFAGARLAAPVQVLGPLAVDASAAGVRGLLLAGDSAGFVDPMTGDGLRFALRGAELAAEAGAEYLERPDEPWHERLLERRTREFSNKQRVNRLLRALVASAPAVRVSARAAALAPIVLRQLIGYAADLHTV